MPLTLYETTTMRRMIAELLEINPERVTPEANFFRELGGTFDHLQPLRLKTEAAFGVDITAITDEVNARTAMKDGHVTKKSLKAIGDYLGLQFGGGRLTFLDLFSIAFIEAITAKAIERRNGTSPASSPRETLSLQFAPFSCATEVRKIVGRVLNEPAERLSAYTDLAQVDGLILAGILMELDAHWGISTGNVIDEILAASRYDKRATSRGLRGNVWQRSFPACNSP